MIARRRAFIFTVCLLGCSDPRPVVAPPLLAPYNPLADLGDEQLFVYEIQEDYSSWAARRGRCATDPWCWGAGLCSPTDSGACAARTIMDCLWSNACARAEGPCTVHNGRCVLGGAPFNPQLVTVEGGHNERITGFLFERPIIARALRMYYCVSAPLGPPPYRSRNLLGCRFSQACAEHELCLLDAGECRPRSEGLRASAQASPPELFPARAVVGFRDDLIAPPEHWQDSRGRCADTDGCFDEGRCTPQGSACVAERAIDCLFSTACRTQDRCRPHEGRCVAGGRALFDRITPSAEEHTARLRVFSASAAPNDPNHYICYLASNLLECRHARDCADEGRCYYDYGACVAGTDAACRRSVACRDQQRCRFDPTQRACVAPMPPTP
ncbi:MAG: hypothetical protein HY908_33140 [Myxococcales bacterium]|nr:hypothetical protein [Myxococcales bacterium]